MSKTKWKFRLTEQDKEYLSRIGHPSEDYWQIEYAFNDVRLTITDKSIVKGCKTRKCKQKRAIEVLGRETFLSGLSRAAFHASAARDNGNYTIYFDLYHWW